MVDICEKCGFYREVETDDERTVETYCERLNCYVVNASCKCIKDIYDKSFKYDPNAFESEKKE